MGLKRGYKKGYFFSIDALIALVVVLAVIFFIQPTPMNFAPPVVVQEDILEVLSAIQIRDLNNSYAKQLISDKTITNLNQSVLEQIGEFYAVSSDNASNLADAIFQELGLNENIGIYFNNQPVYLRNTSAIENASEIWTSRQVISGIQQGTSATGFSARSLLNSANKVDFFNFGGYVGDGNITAQINYDGNLTGASVEAAFGGPFEILINGMSAGNYSPSNPLVPFKVDLAPYLGNFSSGSNTVEFISTSANPLFIAGGFVKISYENDDLFQLQTNRSFPGIQGSINLYDSFSVPGNLTSMEMYLHYDSIFDVFVNVGNTTIYETTPTGETTVFFDNTNLTAVLDYNSMQDTTIPIRFGLRNTSFVTNGTGIGDVFSVIDLSGSMDDSIPGGGTKLTEAQSATKDFMGVVLNTSGNKVGIVEYADDSTFDDVHQLSNNSASLNSTVDAWNADGFTCICCGINNAVNNFLFNRSYSRGGYVAYYDFNGDYDDKSGNDNNLSCTNCPSATVGPDNSGAYDFRTTGDEALTLSNFDPPSQGSVSLWIYRTGSGIRIFGAADNFEIRYDGVIDSDLFGSGGGHTSGTTTINSDQWYHVVATWDFATYEQKIYIDGNLDAVGYSADDDPGTGLTLSIGTRTGSGQDFTGDIDDFRMYDYVLNDQEVIDLYTAGIPLSPSCGNDKTEFGELCDGNLSGQFCSAGSNGHQNCLSTCDGFEASCTTTAICGNGIIESGEQCDDANPYEGDGCDNSCRNELRVGSMVVMSDGVANVQCAEQSTGSSTQDAINAACDAFNNHGITVHAVGFGDTSDVDETTLQSIAACGNGNYYYADVNQLSQIYQDIAQTILLGAFIEQTIEIQAGQQTILYPDSYVKYEYDGITIPNGLVIVAETSTFNNNVSNGSFFVPSDATVVEVNAISYSGSKWTREVSVNNNTIFSLPDYGIPFISLGDPYSVLIPSTEAISGSNNVTINTGLNANDNAGGSTENKVIYRLVRTITGFSPIVSSAQGCLWTVQFESGDNSTFSVPSNYTGSNLCTYGLSGIAYNNNDAIDSSVYDILLQLDLDGDNLIDTLFSQNDLSIEPSEITGIPFTWETEAQIRVWR